MDVNLQYFVLKDFHTCYSYKQIICLYIVIIGHFFIHAGLELNVKNVRNVLHEARFADAHWAELGLQLIDHFELATVQANHRDTYLCMIDTLSQWLKSDSKASWEKLAEVLPKVGGYGEATASIVREKAGILHACMFYV